MLAQHAGKVLTHRQLLREVWGPNACDDTQYLRVYMAQLRHKLEDEPARPRHLLTETGVGYRLKVDDECYDRPPELPAERTAPRRSSQLRVRAPGPLGRADAARVGRTDEARTGGPG